MQDFLYFSLGLVILATLLVWTAVARDMGWIDSLQYYLKLFGWKTKRGSKSAKLLIAKGLISIAAKLSK